jgi:hypothetical protein
MKKEQKSGKSLLKYCVISLCVFASLIRAEQFLLMDTTYLHYQREQGESDFDGLESHWNLEFSDKVPKNWESPVNYSNGKAYWRIAILEKPSDVKISIQPCFNNDDPMGSGQNMKWHMCPKLTRFTSTGVYWTEESRSSFFTWPEWPDWSNWGGYPQIVVKDEINNPIATKIVHDVWAGHPNFDLYYPMKIRWTMYMVSENGTFDPPEWWESNDVNAGMPVPGCTDPQYEEYDTEATVDDGSCETLIVEGCTDPDYEEYDSTATVDDGSCNTLGIIIRTGTKDKGAYQFSGTNKISVQLAAAENFTLEIINMDGTSKIAEKISGKREFNMSTEGFEPGIYFLKVKTQHATHTEKFVVMY